VGELVVVYHLDPDFSLRLYSDLVSAQNRWRGSCKDVSGLDDTCKMRVIVDNTGTDRYDYQKNKGNRKIDQYEHKHE
jgi:hypothetical protein